MEKKSPLKLGSLSRSSEDYLEAIFLESQDHTPVRVKEIGDRLGVAPASVSQAVKTLVSHGLVKSEHYGAIELTDSGYQLGQQISSSHHVLQVFLEEILGMDHESADRDACVVEHALGPEVIAKLSKLIKWLTTPKESEAGTPLEEFRHHAKTQAKANND